MHRPLAIERIEERADDLPGLLARVQGDRPGRRLHVPGRDGDHQFSRRVLLDLPCYIICVLI